MKVNILTHEQEFKRYYGMIDMHCRNVKGYFE
jgi:hypothetical protein